MTRRLRGAAAVAVSLLACGCASASGQQSAATAPAPAGLSATTSLTTAGGASWAAVPMGGTGPNLFWQLFALPAAGAAWSLTTPPAIATNGALILAAQDGPGRGQDAKTLTVGIRPSLDLTFSPVTTTSDDGRDWATTAPDSGLADVPDALAAAPDGSLLALDRDGQVSDTSAAASGWATLTSQRAIAATPAGRDCAPAALTAVAYSPAGWPLLGATCGTAGVAGILAYSGGTWRLAGPALPAALARSRVQVLRLTRTGSTDTALLETGSGRSAVLLAAWTSDTVHWTLSPAFPLRGAQPVSASFGGSGGVGVVLSAGRAAVTDGPDASWRPLPALPAARSITLALPAARTVDALAADGSTLTVWRLAASQAGWSRVQLITVPIEYGSSS